MKKSYRVLVFDIDDTLIIEKHSVVHGLEAIFAAEDKQYTDTDYERWCDIEFKFWDDYRNDLVEIPEIYNDGGRDGFDRQKRDWLRSERLRKLMPNTTKQERLFQLLDIFEDEIKNKVVPHDGMVSLIKDLATANYQLVVATDGVHDIAEHKLKAIGVSSYFDQIFSPLTTGTIKPKPEFFKQIFEQYGDNSADYLIIGNSLNADVRLANNLVIDSCLFNSWDETPEPNNQPTYIANDSDELRQILLS